MLRFFCQKGFTRRFFFVIILQIMVDVDRINYLAKKSRAEGLTEEEKAEQAKLRREYVDSVKRNLEAQLKNTYVIDEKGEKRPLAQKELN